MQIPLLTGVYTDAGGDIRQQFPRNLTPIVLPNGVSSGYLRTADGIEQFAAGTGADRGGIEWNNVCYRVMGTSLVRVWPNGGITTIGDVGGSGFVTFDYSFDYLAVASSGKMYLYNGTTLRQITDPDLGTVVSFCWVDGYFMTTDGTSLIVTELNDPFSVNPLKYGSSEADPDPIECLIKLKNEVYALNRHTIEVFDNVGGEGFPFARIEGAQIQKGCIGTKAACLISENIAFVGSGRNEAPAVWVTGNGTATKISTRDIDAILARYSEEQLSQILVESRMHNGLTQLYVHLSGLTLCHHIEASQAMQRPVWTILSSSLYEAPYRARNAVFCYGLWIVGDTMSNNLGILSENVASHWGENVGWECVTPIIYNDSKGAIIHELILVSVTGRSDFGVNSTVYTSYSLDGLTWSQEWPCKAGKNGERGNRIAWRRCGTMESTRIQKIRGTSDSRLAILRLEATLEALAN